MTDNRYVIGVDPGETCGVVRIEYRLVGVSVESGGFWYATGEHVVIQCTHGSVRSILAWLTAVGNVIISHERFVVSSRASRVKKAAASQITRDINGWIDGLHKTDEPGRRIRVVEHRAADVKPWAVEEKMAALGLVLSPEMRHARDAAKQAAYAGCHDLGAPDPLSKRVRYAEGYGAELQGYQDDAADMAGQVPYRVGGNRLGATHGTVTGRDELAHMVQHLPTVTGRLATSPLPEQHLPSPTIMQWHAASGGQLWSDADPQPVTKAAPDSQAGDQARYIGLERGIKELETGQ